MINVKSSAMSPKVWHSVTPCWDDDIVVIGSRWRNFSGSTHPHTTTDIDVLSVHLNPEPMPTQPNNAMASHLTQIKLIKAVEVPVCVGIIYVYVFLMWWLLHSVACVGSWDRKEASMTTAGAQGNVSCWTHSMLELPSPLDQYKSHISNTIKGVWPEVRP